jgi:hypothetical protein
MAQTSHQNIALSSLALQAVKYAQKVMDIGSDNRLPQAYWGFPARKMCVTEMRDHVEKELAELRRLRLQMKQDVGWKDQLEASASWAKLMGCGNCGEYSALAFVYLRDVLKARPLDWMEYNNMQHAFVIVGRDSGTAPTASNELFYPPAIGKWNTSCIMCDAYYDRVLDYSHLVRELGNRSRLRLLYRYE